MWLAAERTWPLCLGAVHSATGVGIPRRPYPFAAGQRRLREACDLPTRRRTAMRSAGTWSRTGGHPRGLRYPGLGRWAAAVESAKRILHWEDEQRSQNNDP